MDLSLQPEYAKMITDKNIKRGESGIYQNEFVEIIKFDVVNEIATIKHGDMNSHQYSTFISEPFWHFVFSFENVCG